MDLTELLQRHEGKTLEFKRDLSSPDRLLRSVVAFANTSGGTILIGVEDGTRHVLGVPEPRSNEERVTNLIADGVSPLLVPDVELLRHLDRLVLAVRVYPSPSRPHYVGQSPETGAYVRVGSTNRQADADLVAEMQRFARGEAFDEQPMPAVDSDAIDFRAVSESFSEFRKLAQGDLEVLGLCTTHQGRRVASVGGMLLYGHDRLRHFPDAWIQAGRFAGHDKAEIVDRLDLKMPLSDAIPAAVSFIERHMAAGIDIGSVRREPRWMLPPVAVREALVNAVAHADYSQRGVPLRVSIFDDRLEVENPGLLPFGLTLDDLPRGVSKLRNRVIGRVLNELRLVEQWGSGIQRMLAAFRDNGLHPPVWEEIGTRLRVTMRLALQNAHKIHGDRKARVSSSVKLGDQETLASMEWNILDLLDSSEGLRTSQVAEAVGLSLRATRTRLKQLVERGFVVEIGRGRNDPKRTYHKARR